MVIANCGREAVGFVLVIVVGGASGYDCARVKRLGGWRNLMARGGWSYTER